MNKDYHKCQQLNLHRILISLISQQYLVGFSTRPIQSSTYHVPYWILIEHEQMQMFVCMGNIILSVNYVTMYRFSKLYIYMPYRYTLVWKYFVGKKFSWVMNLHENLLHENIFIRKIKTTKFIYGSVTRVSEGCTLLICTCLVHSPTTPSQTPQYMW